MPPATARKNHAATLLPTGKVLVCGGENGGGRLASCTLFDPSNGSSVAAANLPEARGSFTATLLSNGQVLVAGGVDTSGMPPASLALYTPNAGTGSWASLPSPSARPAAATPRPCSILERC